MQPHRCRPPGRSASSGPGRPGVTAATPAGRCRKARPSRESTWRTRPSEPDRRRRSAEKTGLRNRRQRAGLPTIVSRRVAQAQRSAALRAPPPAGPALPPGHGQGAPPPGPGRWIASRVGRRANAVASRRGRQQDHATCHFRCFVSFFFFFFFFFFLSFLIIIKKKHITIIKKKTTPTHTPLPRRAGQQERTQVVDAVRLASRRGGPRANAIPPRARARPAAGSRRTPTASSGCPRKNRRAAGRPRWLPRTRPRTSPGTCRARGAAPHRRRSPGPARSAPRRPVP